MNEPGNNNIAMSIVSLQNSKLVDNGNSTFNDFYSSLIAKVGSDTQEADFYADSFKLTVEKLTFQREAISGVSLDEEMTHLIESQQAFTAASRVVTTVDEMTNTILGMI
jgi:flagellar hook-associated protein 1 FlgK